MTECAKPLRRFNILLAEDNDDDVWLTRRAFQRLPLAAEIHAAKDGVEALKFLRREGPYAAAPTPDLILIDLNMPRMDGRELLVELKRDDVLRAIPAMILSTSAAGRDVSFAYREYAAAYLTKPLYLAEFSNRMQCFVDFWLGDVAILPSSAAVDGI